VAHTTNVLGRIHSRQNKSTNTILTGFLKHIIYQGSDNM